MLDSIGRIWCSLCSVVLAALLWWRELQPGRKMEIGISRNKAVFPFFWRLLVLVLGCGIRRSPEKLFVKLSRRKLGVVGGSGEVFFNKQLGGLLCCWSLLSPFSLLAGRGGEEKGVIAGAHCNDGGGWGVRGTATTWRISSVAQDWRPTLDAGGQQLQGLMPEMRQVFFYLPWRPCVGLVAELTLFTAPSGLVPGAGVDGRRFRPKFAGGVEGPDCVFISLFRVCVVKAKDIDKFLPVSNVLDVSCITPLLF